MAKKNFLFLKRGLISAVVIISILFSSCAPVVTGINISEEDSRYIASAESSRYIFDKSDYSREEALAFVELSQRAVNGICGFLSIPPKAITYTIAENSRTEIDGNNIRLSGVKNQSVNYAAYTFEELAEKDDCPVWLIKNMAEFYGGRFCEWTSPETGDANQSIASMLEGYYFDGIFEFSDEIYGNDSRSCKIRRALARSFFYYLDSVYKESKIIELWENYSSFEETIGKTQAEAMSDWLTSLDIPNIILDGGKLALTSFNTDSYDAVAGLDRTIICGNETYAFSRNELTPSQALEFVRLNSEAISDVDRYLQDAGFSIKNRWRIQYKLEPISGENKEAVVSKDGRVIHLYYVPQEKSEYVAAYFEALLGKSPEAWLSGGMKALLERKFSRHGSPYKIKSTAQAWETLLASGTVQGVTSAFVNIAADDGDLRPIAADFLEYLEKNYGAEKLIKIYQSPSEFENITGTSLQNALYKWLQGLDGVDLETSKPEEAGGESSEHINSSEETASSPERPEEETSSQDKSYYLASYFQANDDGYYYYESERARYYFERGYLMYEEMWNFVQQNDRGIANVKAYLGERYISYDGKLTYYIVSGNGPSYASPSEIRLCFVREKFAEYVHESVHCISGFYSPLWFSEGLAVYIDSVYSEWSTPPAYRQDIHQLAGEYLAATDEETVKDLNDEAFAAPKTAADQERRIQAYIAAASLVKYIEYRYGKENMLKAYTNFGNITYILGKTEDELKADWIEFLINY
jgi:hypothetical protein